MCRDATGLLGYGHYANPELEQLKSPSRLQMRAGPCLMLCVRGYFAAVLLLILLAPLCAHAQEKNRVAPEQVDKAIREIERLAQEQIQENALPGLAIAVVFQDKARYAKGFGVRDVNTKVPADADTVFQLASVSKSVGSTVVAELVGEGKITWDSKLSVLDPTFAMFDPWVTREITILCDGGRERCWQKRHHLYHRTRGQSGTGRRGKS
jgi:hypothetical protein